jgi:hypothetical protein
MKDLETIDVAFSENEVPYNSLVEILLYKGIRIRKDKNLKNIFIDDIRGQVKYNRQHKLTGIFDEYWDGDEVESGKGCVSFRTKDGYTFEISINEIEDYKVLK